MFSHKVQIISEENLLIFKKNVILVYNPTRKNCATSIDEYRMQEIECSTHSNMSLIPHSKICLLQHINWACYQGGWIWRHGICNDDPPSPELWGWD